MDEPNHNDLNLQQSKKIGENSLYKEYNAWLKANQVLIDPALLYPAYFGTAKNGVVGVAATKAIPQGQAIIAIPYDLIITVDKAKEDPQLLKIIQDNPNLFKYSEEAAFFILTLYMCSELVKGKKSFYAPYFAVAEDNSFSNWTHWDILTLENGEIARQIKYQGQENQQHFMSFLSIFRRYPNVFPTEMSNTQYKQIFSRSYSFICTRAFGWSLPSISLIPMADSLNHNNEYVTHMLIDVNLEKQPHEMYSVKNKKYNLSLLSQLYPELPKNQAPLRKKHRRDKFVQKHKQILQGGNKKDGPAYVLWQQYKAGVRNFRQLHFYDESCEQDNDTDDETIQKMEFSIQQFRFYEKYETSGINEKNKTQQLIKYWKMFLDPVVKEDQQSSEEEVQEKKSKPSAVQADKIKQKFVDESKQSEGSSLVSSSSSSDSDDEEFKWMAGNPDSHNHKTTYFIMATRKPVKKNEQVYNFYGRRSNKFLLIGYNFVLDQNKYDSFGFRINLDNWHTTNKPFETKLPVSKLIKKEGKTKTFFTSELKIKKQKVCIELINHCRALLIGWSNLKTEQVTNKIRITIPFSIEFEKKVLSLASQFIKTIEKQFMTTIQEDEELLQKAQKHEAKMALKIKIIYKETLQAQLELLERCQQALKVWKNGRVNINNEQEMRELGKIRHYLCSLERARI